MPVENEDKFVLGRPEALRDALAALHPCRLLDQFYLSPQARFRRTLDLGRPGSEPEHEFTYKQLIDGRLLELPIPVGAEDYALAAKAAVSSVHKARFSFPDSEPGAHWDVDFLLDRPGAEGGRVAFSLAEVEFPEGGAHGMPDILRGHVELAVPRGDAHLFSWARLSQPGYVDGLLERYRGGWRG